MRLNQYLAKCGECSRRGADKLIESGAVKVDGEVAKLGMNVDEESIVTVNDRQIFLPKSHIVLAYYKPVGVTCSEKDDHAKRLVTDEIKSDRRLTYAGRLDRDSEGLLLMTDDGELINAMMKGSNKHEKEYIVKVDKPLKTAILSQMSAGVYLKDLDRTTRPCKIEQLDEYTFNIVLTQGMNRQIRRMCDNFGLNVISLKRTRVMNITLGNLQVGASRELAENELKKLYFDCELDF